MLRLLARKYVDRYDPGAGPARQGMAFARTRLDLAGARIRVAGSAFAFAGAFPRTATAGRAAGAS
jgi:hypothetical protein